MFASNFQIFHQIRIRFQLFILAGETFIAGIRYQNWYALRNGQFAVWSANKWNKVNYSNIFFVIDFYGYFRFSPP